mmetsp:Transcript_66728/g.168380  ORF Transcript_66728/g.168380 Transcript_66728/m.168380 type:complete len:313 (-) Transcript_66728:653-1591(-)
MPWWWWWRWSAGASVGRRFPAASVGLRFPAALAAAGAARLPERVSPDDVSLVVGKSNPPGGASHATASAETREQARLAHPQRGRAHRFGPPLEGAADPEGFQALHARRRPGRRRLPLCLPRAGPHGPRGAHGPDLRLLRGPGGAVPHDLYRLCRAAAFGFARCFSLEACASRVSQRTHHGSSGGSVCCIARHHSDRPGLSGHPPSSRGCRGHVPKVHRLQRQGRNVVGPQQNASQDAVDVHVQTSQARIHRELHGLQGKQVHDVLALPRDRVPVWAFLPNGARPHDATTVIRAAWAPSRPQRSAFGRGGGYA